VTLQEIVFASSGSGRSGAASSTSRGTRRWAPAPCTRRRSSVCSARGRGRSATCSLPVARRRALRREPEPPLQARAVPGHPEAAPADIQEQYLASLEALGIDPSVHDVRFEEDNWESPTLGAWGSAGRCCSTARRSPSSRTSSRRAGSTSRHLRRDHLRPRAHRHVPAGRGGRVPAPLSGDTLYRDVRHEEEFQLSRYSFELADVELHRRTFDSALAEAGASWRRKAGALTYPRTTGRSRALTPSTCSTPRAISVTERAGMILKIRKLACAVARAYVDAVASPPDGGEEAGRG